MKRLRFIPALLLILSACSETIIEMRPAGSGEGSVSISLTADMRTEDAVTKTDADLPDIDDFRVAIYKTATQMRLYNDSYANTKGKEIKLNAGEYRLVAQHGDTLGCGFDKPYYMADPTFMVEGYGTQVQAEARLANVRMAVEYGETIADVYSDYYTVVKHKRYTSKEVRFTKGETRYGYLPGGEFRVLVYVLDVDGDGNEVWKYSEIQPTEDLPLKYEPNDFVTFSVTTADASGKLRINITIDRSMETVDKDVEIPAFTVPQDAPSITPAGFEEGGVHYVTEGLDQNHTATANFVARGELSHSYLKVNSEYLASLGVPAEVDFANLTGEQEALLRSVGFTWDPEMLHNRSFSFIEFTGVINNLQQNVPAAREDKTIAEFILKVEDSVGKAAEQTFTIKSLGIAPTLAVEDYNVWACRIVSPVATVNRGSESLMNLQYSTDNSTWTDFDVVPAQNGYVYTYESLPVEPATTYYLRSVYNHNPACSSPVVTVTTEAAAQLGNSGFEDYQLVQTKFTPAGGIIGGGSYNRNWYLPYASGETDPWWACNSMKSMPDGHTGWSETWHKNFPSSGYVKSAHSGNKAALLFCVNVGGGNTSSDPSGKTYNGEIWIGTADNSGNQATQGHTFASRPAKLSFWYKYAPTDGKNFFVETWIKDAAGNLIASSKETAGQAAGDWTRYELPFNYSNLQAKAAAIYVWISSAYEEGSVKAGVTFDLGEESVKAHAGCFLTIDDLELIYE